MTRDTDYELRIQSIHLRAKRPLRSLTASLLTLLCGVALLSEPAHAASRSTRELNAAAAAAAGQSSDRVEGAVRNAATNGRTVTPASSPVAVAVPAPRPARASAAAR
ncbi:hypothetical protein, partial [Inquilinus limosus]